MRLPSQGQTAAFSCLQVMVVAADAIESSVCGRPVQTWAVIWEILNLLDTK